MKSFSHDKILGLDGRPFELFLHFQDIMGTNIFDAAKESRKVCYILGDINSTFTTFSLRANNIKEGSLVEVGDLEMIISLL